MSVQSDMSASTLVDLAPELLELVLSYLEPHDLLSFARTCRRANEYIRPSNQILWKAAFLHVFDHPKHAWACWTPTARAANRQREERWDWYRELRRRCLAFDVLYQANQVAPKDIADVVTTLLEVHQTASYPDVDGPECLDSLNLNFLDRLRLAAPKFDTFVHDYQHDSSLALPYDPEIERNRPMTRSMAGHRATTPPEWASRFHIIYGPTSREQESVAAKAAARALVYDWSNTGEAADYGPLINDNSGTVNWPVVEAISSLMHRIFNTALKAYGLRHSGFATHMPNGLPLDVERFSAPHDWAGATGEWLGTYAFLDYRALVHYNFGHNQEFPLDLGNYEEACGDLMHLLLTIDDSEEIRQDPRLQSSLPACKDLPTLYFGGTSGSPATGRPSIGVRGSVSLVPGGREVRWRFIIRYAGADQWQLEGVQPGGIRSGPIYGLWTHVEHDENGPTGPFYYCPLSLCDTMHN